jgi:hypothetical protein
MIIGKEYSRQIGTPTRFSIGLAEGKLQTFEVTCNRK